jgi:hypothetical protein
MRYIIAFILVISLIIPFAAPVQANAQLLGSTANGTGSNVIGYVYYTQFTAGFSGTLITVNVYSLVTGNVKAGIYTDNGGKPGTLLASNNTGTTVATIGWNTVTLSSTTAVASGTNYWLAAIGDITGVTAQKSTTGKHLFNSVATYTAGLPATFPSSYGDFPNNELSIQGWGDIFATPSVTTQAASLISNTTARLNAAVVDYGGQLSDIRFAYDNITHVHFTDYANMTAWVINTYNTGDNPYVDITGLTASSTYYFRVQIANDYGTATGSELTFATSSGVGTPSSITAICNSTSISLNWVKGSGAGSTLVRYRAGSYPTSTSEGILAYLGTSESKVLTGLAAGTTYYFSAWGVTSGVYSSSYASTLGTTTAFDSATGTGQKLVQPTPDPTWTQTPSSTKLATIPIFGQLVQDNATAYQQPVNYLWFFIWMLIAAAIFVVVYIKGQFNYVLAAFCSLGFIGIGVWWYNIVAGGIVILIGIIGVAWALVGFRRTGA